MAVVGLFSANFNRGFELGGLIWAFQQRLPFGRLSGRVGSRRPRLPFLMRWLVNAVPIHAEGDLTFCRSRVLARKASLLAAPRADRGTILHVR